MLFAECHELQPPAAEEPARPVVPLRRLAVTFAPESRQAAGMRTGRRDGMPAVRVPAYSRIVFRAGTTRVR
jgi:hypothetical protein